MYSGVTFDLALMAGTRQCKVLNVAEKNDAAKELAKIMSKGRFQRVSSMKASYIHANDAKHTAAVTVSHV